MATAFAVYSADDNSLNFYKRDTVPSAGDSFDGRTATAVYTGIETDSYIWDSAASVATTPWYGYHASITSVNFVDRGITPVSTAYWFRNMNNPSLTTINGLDKLDTSNVTTMQQTFANCPKLTSLDVSGFVTANVTNMSSMFNYCKALTSLDVSSFNTSNVINMSYMFYGCQSLTSLDLGRFNTSNVINMSYMFYDCSKLTTLDLSSFDTYNVTDMSYMFQNCKALTSLNLTNFDTSKVTNMSYMFYYCSALTSLDVSGFNTSNVTNMNYMFKDCKALSTIYAGDGWRTNSVTSSSNMFYNCSQLPNFDSSVVDKTNAHYNTGGYLRYISAADKVKVILEKGALDIILNKIKNSKSGPTISASGDTLTIIN